MDIQERFWSKVNKQTDSGCWEWMAGKTSVGYGLFSIQVAYRKNTLICAHRWSYEERNGRIQDGLQVDHLCRNPSCVNPDHLEAVTPSENVRRGMMAKPIDRTRYCKRGHEYTGENLYVYPNGDKCCRTCHRSAERERDKRKRESES